MNAGSLKALVLAVQAGILGFHAIWWPFVVPVFRTMERELETRGLTRTQQGAGPKRSAALTPRRIEEYLPGWMRGLAFAVGAAGIGGLTWRLALHTPEQIRLNVMIVTFSLSGVFLLVAWGWWIRREMAAPYVADGAPENATARMAEAESLRRFRMRGICALQIAGAATFFAFAIACVELDRGAISERALGIAGGIAGTLVGTAGAVFGAVAGIRTQRAMRTNYNA
jgi:hypothetical protein